MEEPGKKEELMPETSEEKIEPTETPEKPEVKATETKPIETEIRQELKEEKKPEKPKKGLPNVPIYLAALLLVFGLFLGYVGHSFIAAPCKPVVIADENCVQVPPTLKLTTVEVKVFTSAEFGALQPEKNTFLDVLDQRGLPYSIGNIDLSTEEGQALAEKFGIKFLPTLLVKEDDLKVYAAINTDFKTLLEAMKNSYELIDGYFVVPEMYLDNKFHLKMYLTPPYEACSTALDNIKVYLFYDPYNPSAVIKNFWIEKLMENYTGTTDFEFVFNPTTSLDENAMDTEAALLTTKYLLATQAQGKYKEFNKCFINAYCDQDEDGLASESEIMECENAPHYNTPLELNELKACVTEAGLNEEELEEFLENEAENAINAVKEIVQAYGFENQNGVLSAVNCNVSHHLFYVDDILCNLNPEIPICGETEQTSEETEQGTDQETGQGTKKTEE